MFFQMSHMSKFRSFFLVFLAFGLAACANLEEAPGAPSTVSEKPFYRIGPGDGLTIFVWRNPELSTGVVVRPDGRISVPLIEDMEVTNKTPTELAREIEKVLGEYVQNPVVTVIMTGFLGPYDQQVRVVGEAAQPQAIPYRENMTVLDLMITVGGLTDFAAGNRAVLLRRTNNGENSYNVRLDDLLKDGDITANAAILPGDVLIVPQSWF